MSTKAGEGEPMSESAKHIFKVEYFIVIANTVAQALERRFQQIENYKTLFEFLYYIKELKAIGKMIQICQDLESFPGFEEKIMFISMNFFLNPRCFVNFYRLTLK